MKEEWAISPLSICSFISPQGKISKIKQKIKNQAKISVVSLLCWGDRNCRKEYPKWKKITLVYVKGSQQGTSGKRGGCFTC